MVGVVASVPGGSIPPAVLQFEESNKFNYRTRETESNLHKICTLIIALVVNLQA